MALRERPHQAREQTQQMQQRLDESQQRIQETEQQLHHYHQQQQQMQQQMDELEQQLQHNQLQHQQQMQQQLDEFRQALHEQQQQIDESLSRASQQIDESLSRASQQIYRRLLWAAVITFYIVTLYFLIFRGSTVERAEVSYIQLKNSQQQTEHTIQQQQQQETIQQLKLQFEEKLRPREPSKPSPKQPSKQPSKQRDTKTTCTHTTVTMSTSLSQAFRTQSHSKIITIPTRLDAKSKQRIVRWKDIQQYFKDAQGVMNGDDAVLFLTDDDLEDLIPLRIAHHPGVVLEVVMAIDEQHDSRSVVTPIASVTLEQGLSSSSDSRMNGAQPAHSTSGDIRPMETDVAALKIMDTDNSQALVVHSQSLLSENRVSLHSSSTLYNTIHQPVSSSSHGHSTTSAEQFIDGGVERRLLEMGSTMAQQEELRQLRQQMQQMQQQMDGIRQQAENSRQQVRDSQQQLQQQVDEVVQKIQELYQRTQHFQQIDTVLQQIDAAIQEVRHKNQDVSESKHTLEQEVAQLPEVARKGQEPELRWLSTDRLALMQFRINELLDTSVGELSVPRLFVVLPKSTPSADGNRDSRPLQFRLHFLCESSAHTKEHEAHFVNHPGYELTKPNEFFDKYGSYLLTMAYMVKFRSMSRSRLWPSSVTDETSTNQDHLSYVRNNIHGLLDEAIRHLEEITGNISGDMEDIAHWMLSAFEHGQVEQYFKIEVGEGYVSCDILPTITHDGHYIWVCDEHRRQHHESTMKHLEQVIEANGGKCSIDEGDIEIEVVTATETLSKMFRDVIVKLCNTPTSEGRTPLKVLRFNLDGVDPSGSTKDIVIDQTQLNSLELRFRRVSLSVHIAEGGAQDTVMEINCLADIAQEEIDFIQQCRPVLLLIMDTPEKEDEDRLVNILQQNPTLTELDIRCIGDRSFAVIDFIISTMEKIRQDMGSSALRTSVVAGQWVAPLGSDDESNCDIGVTVSFSTDSDALDMETNIRLPDDDIHAESPVRKFITQYGWSIRTLRARWSFNDEIATLLDDATRERGSRIMELDLNPFSLTVSGLDALDRVIKRSQSFTRLRLVLSWLKDNRTIGTAMTLLGRYRDKLHDLFIQEDPTATWVHEFVRAFPTRASFPELRDLYAVVKPSKDMTAPVYVQWIISMVSTPSQTISSSSSTTPLADESQEMGSIAPLNNIVLSGFQLQPEDWESLVGALDLSSLVEMNLEDSNFSQDQLKLLVDRIEAFGPRPVSLKTLSVPGTGLIPNAKVNALFKKLEGRDPAITINRE
ncbi:hypothetical protein BGX34_010968 [Mortierella sp. NVP85]|nr:hypothetical protein BGX34_010968 [Mortierella sp. NVP85]